MAGVDFFQPPPDPTADPQGYMRARDMASMLMKQGMTSPQGQNVNGHFVAPNPLAYAAQMAGALAGGYKRGQLRDAWNKPQQAPFTAPTPVWGANAEALPNVFGGGA